MQHLVQFTVDDGAACNIVFLAMSDNAKPAPESLPPAKRAASRLLQTVRLLRANAPDTDEAAFYLNEERRFARMIQKTGAAA